MAEFKQKSKYLKYRRLTQIGLGLVLTNSFYKVWWTTEIYKGPLKSVCIPGLNCHACPMALLSCPIGILQHYAAIQQIPFLLLGYLTLIGILFGRAVCGWICPFGWIQEMWYKIKSRKFGILKIFHRLKWAVLIVLAIVLPFFTGVHWFSKLCPYGGLIGGIPWALWNPNSPVTEEPVIEAAGFGFWFWLKMIILAGFIVWFVLAKRPFCRTVCPLGAIFSLFNRISWFKIEVSAKCPDCDSCNSLCPMDLKVREEADFENCIKCLDCTACKHVKSKFSLRYGFTKAVKAHKLKPVVQTTSFARDR